MSGDAAIRTESGPHGEVLHVVPFLPPALPPVSKFHLERAWDAARDAAIAARGARLHGFRFSDGSAEPLNLLIADPDALYWTVGVETVADLSSAYGISLCLRLLAMVAVMGSAGWVRPWFNLTGAGGADIHPALLHAAAVAPLTPQGGFAETSLRALLPDAMVRGA